MAWQKKNTPEHRELIDARTGMHVIPLHEPETGAEHKLQINIGHDACAHCGHVAPKDNLGKLDTQQIIADEIAALTQSHAGIHAYAAEQRVQVRKASAKGGR